MGRRSANPLLALGLLVLPALAMVGLYQQRPDLFTAQPVAPPTTQTTAASGPPTIRIATWNIQHLGGRQHIDMKAIAGIIQNNAFDVVAVQEVMGNGQGIDVLLNTLGHPWRGSRLSAESRSGERLAFIYRGDHVTEIAPAAPLEGATATVFERVPYRGSFRAGNFDFELVAVHLSYTDTHQRAEEARELAALVSSRVQHQSEKDVIILGDFNEQKARPNLHYFNAVGWQTVVTDRTNLSSRETFDHIVLCPRFTREYTGTTAVVHFDETLYGNQDKRAASEISDHRPAWAEFSTTMPDDD
jgi:endonuclease/exonuclease/phosphatase family metal-dependent hydrolase